MSDLRVTDVQAALRHFQTLGHDVLTNPRMLNLEGKQYGLALGHSLKFLKGSRATYLHSTLMQSERPLLTEMHTGFYPQTPSFEKSIRGVSALTPSVIVGKDGTEEHHAYVSNINHLFEGKGSWLEESQASTGSPLWTPSGGYENIHKDIHEALQSHKTSEVSHIGSISFYPNTGHDVRDMTNSELAKFPHNKVIERKIPGITPFRGLIAVTSHNGKNDTSHYTYDPETEQLMDRVID